MNRRSLALLSLATLAPFAYAHNPICDCFDNGDDTITCEGGFSDGGTAVGVPLRVLDETGKVLIDGAMSAQSDFTFPKPKGAFRVEFDGGAGHVITIDVNSQPYTLAPDQGSWDEHRDAVADRAIATLDGYMPGLQNSIIARQVLSPVDLESLLGISGGHALHGDMSFDQLFTLRPVRGHADYRTPIRDLYLCGAGTHPGGGVSGANGRNCAREVIRDARGPASRLGLRARRF